MANANAAAFQLALLEMANDNKNLNTGVVKLNGSTGTTLVANANFILGNLNYSGPKLYNLMFYQVDRDAGGQGQDYNVASLDVSPVPEPSTYAMLAIDLLALGGIARRRTSLQV